MADRSVVVRLRAETTAYIAGLKKAGLATRELGREISGAGRTGQKDLDQIGRTAAVMAGSIALGLAASAKAAIDWESAWAGVTKTVEGSASELSALEDGLRQMATELPATHGEIAAVAEAAGALGIATPAIEGFTRTMIDLGETTDLTADQAANSMARIANVMQTPQTEFERMGSTLVELGNNGASTESEILELANRLAAAGQIAGLSEADVFAFASTLASVGVEAEAGGTALSKVFTSIRDATIDGGEKLETFARVAGVTATSFADSFRDDPAQAITTFIQGLGRMNDAGQSTSGVFSELELTDQRLMRALLSTASAGSLLTDQISMAAGAWQANNALQTEAEKRYATTAAQAEMLRNKVVELGIGIGGQLIPVVAGAVDVLAQMAEGFMAMPGPVKGVAAGILGVSAAGLGLAAGAALLIPKIRAMQAALIGMGTAGRTAAAAIPWLAAAAAAVGVVSYVLGRNAQAAQEAEERVKSWTDAIREAGSVVGGAEARLSELATEHENVASAIDESGLSLGEWARGLSGTDAQFDSFIGKLREAEAAGADLGAPIDFLAHEVFPGLRDEIRQGAEGAEVLGRVLEDTGASGAAAAGGIDQSAEAIAGEGEEAITAADALRELTDARRAQVDPLFAMLDALQQHHDAQASLNEGLAANTDAIADNNISAEELASRYRDLASNALGVEIAASELKVAMDTGAVSIDGARSMLDGFVASGLLTAAQAAAMAVQFGIAESEASKYAGDYTATAHANTGPAIAAFNRLFEAARRAYAAGAGAGAPPSINQIERSYSRVLRPLKGSEAGGRVGPGMPPPGRTDTVPAMLAPGEYVLRAASAQALGYDTLDRLNQHGSFGGGGAAAGGSGYGAPVTNGGLTFAPRIDVHATPGTNGREVGGQIVDALDRWVRDNGSLPSNWTN